MRVTERVDIHFVKTKKISPGRYSMQIDTVTYRDGRMHVVFKDIKRVRAPRKKR